MSCWVSSVVVLLLIVALARAQPCGTGACVFSPVGGAGAGTGVCFGGVAGTDTVIPAIGVCNLCQTLYAGKTYTYRVDANFNRGEFSGCLAPNPTCNSITFTVRDQSTFLTPVSSVTLRGDTDGGSDEFSFRVNEADNALGGAAFIDFQNLALGNNSLQLFTGPAGSFAWTSPVTGCAGGGAARRSVATDTSNALPAPPAAATFGEWRGPVRFYIPAEQSLEGTDSLTVQFLATRPCTPPTDSGCSGTGNIWRDLTATGNNNAAGNCALRINGQIPSSTSFTFTASVQSVDVSVQCNLGGLIDEQITNVDIRMLYSSGTGTTLQYFRASNVNLNDLTVSSTLISAMVPYEVQFMYSELHSADENGLTASTQVYAVSRDTQGRLMPVTNLASGVTVSIEVSSPTFLTVNGGTSSTTSFSISNGFTLDQFTLDVNFPPGSFFAGTPQTSFSLSVESSDSDRVVVSTLAIGSGLRFDDEPLVQDFIIFDVAAPDTASIDGMIPFAIVPDRPLGSGDSLQMIVVADDGTVPCEVSADNGATWSNSQVVAFSSTAQTATLWARVDMTAATVPPADETATSFTCSVDFWRGDTFAQATGGGLTTLYSLPASVALTFERYGVFVDQADVDDMLAGQGWSFVVTVNQLPPSAGGLVVTPYVNGDGGLLSEFTLSAASLTFSNTDTTASQSLTMTPSVSLLRAMGDTISLPNMRFELSGADAHMYFIGDSGATAPEVEGYALTMSESAISLRWGATSDNIYVTAFPAPAAGSNSLTVDIVCDYATPNPAQLIIDDSTGASAAFTVTLDAGASQTTVDALQCRLSLAGAGGAEYAVWSNGLSPLEISVIDGEFCGVSTWMAGGGATLQPGETRCGEVGISDGGVLSGDVVLDVMPTDADALTFSPAMPVTFSAGETVKQLCFTANRGGEIYWRMELSGAGASSVQRCATDIPAGVFSFSAAAPAFTVSAPTSGVWPLRQYSVGFGVSLPAPVPNGGSVSLSYTSPQQPDVTFSPAGPLTFTGDVTSFTVEVQYAPSAAPLTSVDVEFALSGPQATMYATPATLTIAVETHSWTLFNPATLPTIAAQNQMGWLALNAPAPNGIDFTVTSECMSPRQATVSFAAGELIHTFEFDWLTQFAGLSSAVVCDFTVETSGADVAFYLPEMDVIAAPVTMGRTTPFESISLASNQQYLIDGERSASVFVTLDGEFLADASGIVTVTPVASNLQFVPEVLFFSPTAPMQQLTMIPTSFVGGGPQTLRFEVSGADDADLVDQARAALSTTYRVMPKVITGPIGSLSFFEDERDSWVAVGSDLSGSGPMSVRVACRTGGGAPMMDSMAPILFDPPVLVFDTVTTNLSYTYRVNPNEYLRQNSRSGPTDRSCTLGYWMYPSNIVSSTSSPYAFVPINDPIGGKTVSIIALTPGTITPELPNEIPRYEPKRFEVFISPPSSAEVVVAMSSPNLVFNPAVLVIPAGQVLAEGYVEVSGRAKPADSTTAYSVTWTVMNDAATYYSMACGDTSCTTYHRGSL